MRSKKAQTFLTAMFALVVFGMIWALFLANWIGEWGRRAVEDNGLSGLEAFLYMNLNVVIFIALIMFVFVAAYFTR